MPLHPWVKLLSESGHPHSDANWPHSRKVAEVNVRRLYNFPDPEPTTTRSGVPA